MTDGTSTRLLPIYLLEMDDFVRRKIDLVLDYFKMPNSPYIDLESAEKLFREYYLPDGNYNGQQIRLLYGGCGSVAGLVEMFQLELKISEVRVLFISRLRA